MPYKCLISAVVCPGYEPDEALAAKLSTFHHDMSAQRARRLGMVADAWHLRALVTVWVDFLRKPWCYR